jgi:hypothetical protein
VACQSPGASRRGLPYRFRALLTGEWGSFQANETIGMQWDRACVLVADGGYDFNLKEKWFAQPTWLPQMK